MKLEKVNDKCDNDNNGFMNNVKGFKRVRDKTVIIRKEVPMNSQSALAALRSQMADNYIDMYIIPTSDFHSSEYVGDYFKSRAFVTGFTGSAGTAVVTQKKAYLWADGRYFIQAERQIKDRGFELMKAGVAGVPTVSGICRKEYFLRSDIRL